MSECATAGARKLYGVVYLIRNSVNGKVYVGQTTGTALGRFSDHCYMARRGSAHRIHQAIRKYGANVFSVEVLDTACSQLELNEKETSAIAIFDACDYSLGYNMAPTAFGASEEARRKLSEAFTGERNPMFGRPGTRRGVKLSPETLAKRAASFASRKALGLTNGGGPWTTERRELICSRFSREGNPFFGRKHSAISRAKMSASKKGKKLDLSDAEHKARSDRATGINNPMFGRKLSTATLDKKRERWVAFRAAGRKMNLTEDQRAMRRQQAANARAKLAMLVAERRGARR